MFLLKGHYMSDKLLTVDQVADRLQVSRRTIYRLKDHGAFPEPIHVGRAVRWQESDVKQYLDEARPEATS